MLSPERFQSVLQSLTEEEQEVLLKIVREYAETGESPTYKGVWLEDYEEIPVDIDTFLESDDYIGGLTRHGTQIYPFWRDRLREMFQGGDLEASEVAFTGAIGIGKTAIADYAISYLLYRLMCLRNPQRYFGFADTDEIAIFFFNATVELAMSVGYKRLHSICLESPWFMARGSQGGSDSNPYYIPPKHITIKAGSKASHGLGQQIYCLVGSTPVITDTGVHPIQELVGKTVNVLQLTPQGWKYEPAPVYLTGYVDTTIRVTLEDGSVIEGTADHRVMLKDGSYKALGDLTEDDELYSEEGFDET
jgi:hypothetical protein